jgi:hypothetical protein
MEKPRRRLRPEDRRIESSRAASHQPEKENPPMTPEQIATIVRQIIALDRDDPKYPAKLYAIDGHLDRADLEAVIKAVQAHRAAEVTTHYRLSRNDIPVGELLPRLEPFGITQKRYDNYRRSRYADIRLTDGETGILWVHIDDKSGMLYGLTSYTGNPERILKAIREAFDTQTEEIIGWH